MSVLRANLDDVTGKLRCDGCRLAACYCDTLNRDKTADAERLAADLKALQGQCGPTPLFYCRILV